MEDNYDRLTNEAKVLLLKLYQEYQNRRALGIARRDAKYFPDNPGTLKKVLDLSDSEEDILDYVGELKSEEFVTAWMADDSFMSVWLSNVAISRMQNRFKKGVKTALELLLKAR